MMKDRGGKQAMSFPRYGKLFRDFSTLWKNFFHTVENEALVAWTSRAAHLPILLHGFFCSARTSGRTYRKIVAPFRGFSSPLFFPAFMSSNSFPASSPLLSPSVSILLAHRSLGEGGCSSVVKFSSLVAAMPRCAILNLSPVTPAPEHRDTSPDTAPR